MFLLVTESQPDSSSLWYQMTMPTRAERGIINEAYDSENDSGFGFRWFLIDKLEYVELFAAVSIPKYVS